MREEEEYKREVIVITMERDNKRLLDIYRRGEEKDTLSERAGVCSCFPNSRSQGQVGDHKASSS